MRAGAWIAAAVIVAGSAAFAASAVTVERLSLVSETPMVIVYGADELATIPPGVFIAVHACRDEKQVITPLVRIGDRTGEVRDGRFRVQRTRRPLADGLPPLSCLGF
ncbi:hypothetical protein ACFSCV_09680 [Methylopila henanensis]|uniref:Uncharacterized protein n=1 Tax=Methylopila henanensis TaxID=873516 RepID=A0ABW4K535_9HYPH